MGVKTSERIGNDVIARLKKSLKTAGEALEKDPVIYVDAKGKLWFNDPAKDFLSRRDIPVEDFSEWLKIGSSHLQRLAYCNINIVLMRLPEDGVIGFLREECNAPEVDNFNLTHKEKEVLGLLVRGLSNKKMADVMKVSPGTINSHLDSVYRKLSCSNRLEASFMALKNGLFLPSKISPRRKRP